MQPFECNLGASARSFVKSESRCLRGARPGLTIINLAGKGSNAPYSKGWDELCLGQLAKV